MDKNATSASEELDDVFEHDDRRTHNSAQRLVTHNSTGITQPSGPKRAKISPVNIASITLTRFPILNTVCRRSFREKGSRH